MRVAQGDKSLQVRVLRGGSAVTEYPLDEDDAHHVEIEEMQSALDAIKKESIRTVTDKCSKLNANSSTP